MLRDPLATLSEVHERFGPVVSFHVGPFPVVSVVDPELAQHVLVRNHRNYVKSRSYQGLRLVLGNGLVTSEGDHWRRQRKLVQPSFGRQRLDGFAQTMVACVQELLAQWDLGRDGCVDLHEQMMGLTLRIVGRTLFGAELGSDLGALGPAVTAAIDKANEYAQSMVRLPLWLPTRSNRRFAAAKVVLDKIVYDIIESRRQSGHYGQDVLGTLLAATDETGTERMDNAQLRDEVMTLFLAGHETIATAMVWTFVLLQSHPRHRQRVVEELERVLAGRAPTVADLPRLAYLGQVVDESLRLYPPAWIVEREALQDDVLGPWQVRKGTIVVVSPWAMHRQPQLWGDPLTFRPERFAAEEAEGRPKHAYLPFGAGPRVCIGNHFALMEAKIILATILQRYEVEVVAPQEVRPDPKVTLRPGGKVPTRIRPRVDRFVKSA